MNRSIVIGEGIWQYEFLDDKIAVAKWDEPPTSTLQWININSPNPIFTSKCRQFYLEGTCNEDIRVVPIWDEAT